jgi:hypothetical protein
MKWAFIFVCSTALLVHAQGFSQRGFVEIGGSFYPQTFPIDPTRGIGGILVQYEPKWRPKPWFTLSGSFDVYMASHQQVAPGLHFDWQDRLLQRSTFSVRELAAVFTKAHFTITLGKQFIRWGEADFLNPTDQFAPTDLLNLVDQEVLPVTAVRVRYGRGNNNFNFVWQPGFTPARIPLVNQRWTFLPPAYYYYDVIDKGSMLPGRSSFGIRWGHSAARYEYSLSYYNGFNCFPDFNDHVEAAVSRVTFSRVYPTLRLYGGDLTVPLSQFTFKAEGAYYTSSTKNQDEYVLYLLQVERQIHELWVMFGYVGEVVTAQGDALQYPGQRGFARGFISNLFYTIDSNRTLTLDMFIRQNGASSLVIPAYSQSLREHWRATVGFAWLRGEPSDFLGQYHRNSFVSAGLRYSF